MSTSPRVNMSFCVPMSGMIRIRTPSRCRSAHPPQYAAWRWSMMN